MYSSFQWQEALTENNPNGPAFNAWRTKDPAKQLFDVFMQHKKSIKTCLEQHDIDIKQSNQWEYWKQKYTMKKKQTDQRIKKTISGVIRESEDYLYESIHDAYLLPKEWFLTNPYCITGEPLQYCKFSHFPLIRYFCCNAIFYYPQSCTILITPIDWQNISSIPAYRHSNIHMKLPHNYQLTIPEQYKAFYTQKIKGIHMLVKKIEQQTPDTITPGTALIINACALGLIATTAYAAYKYRDYCTPQQTMLAHNFLQTHVTTATRQTYQFLYTIRPGEYSLNCKQILDNALLTQHMVGPVTLDQGMALQGNQNLLKLHTSCETLQDCKVGTAILGYFALPLLYAAITSVLCNTSIVQSAAKGIAYLYNRLFEVKKTEKEL